MAASRASQPVSESRPRPFPAASIAAAAEKIFLRIWLSRRAVIGLPSFIIGIIAMTKQNTDWEGSRRLARIGWIVLGSLFALAILAVIAFIVIGVATDTSQY